MLSGLPGPPTAEGLASRRPLYWRAPRPTFTCRESDFPRIRGSRVTGVPRGTFIHYLMISYLTIFRGYPEPKPPKILKFL